jgi:hypothetical protein
MVFPLLPAVAGIAGGALASNALSKKGSSTSTTTNRSYTDSRQIDVTYPVYQVQIDSPMASQTTKKESAQRIEPSFAAGGSGGTDLSALIPVALIIAGAVVIKEIL